MNFFMFEISGVSFRFGIHEISHTGSPFWVIQ